MTKQEAINYIEDFTWGKTKLGLSRTRALLEGLGNPQDKLKFIHVAGSNGKGSTCAFIASVLTKAGYKTGFYSSPYLVDFLERIRIGDDYIDGARLAEITEQVKDIADGLDDHPTQFEIITAIGLQYFKEEQCDFVVLEVGMGGEFDSTNVIDTPEIAVITNIGLEHTEYLGDTIEEVASAKAGIIKHGGTVVCYDGDERVTKVVQGKCEQESAMLIKSDFSTLEPISKSLDGQRFTYKNDEYEISLLGSHQQKNAAVSIEVIEQLIKKGYRISTEALHKGLRETRWPGRFEVLEKGPLFILDGGHNPQCASALADTIREYFPGKKFVFIAGVLADKNYEEVVDTISPFAYRFICVTPNSPRALPADEFDKYLKGRDIKSEVASDAHAAIKRAHDVAREADGIIAFGSLYLAGLILKEYETKAR